MKKLLSMILVCAMMLALLPAGHVFADGAVAIEISTATAAPADEGVEVYIGMTAEPHWSNLEMTVSFDPDVLVYKGFRRNPALVAQASSSVLTMFTLNTDSASNGSIGLYYTTADEPGGYIGYYPDGYDYFGVLVFDVAATASVGLSEVSATVEYLTDFMNEAVSFTTSAGGVNVIACEHDWQITAHQDEDCETAGYTDYECSICHSTKHVDIPARGHYWNELERVEPTTDTEGYVTYECVWCGATRTEILTVLPPFDGIRVRLEKVAATPGTKNVDLKVYIEDEPHWGSLSFKVYFDPDAVSYKSVVWNPEVTSQRDDGEMVFPMINKEHVDEGWVLILFTSAYVTDGYEGYHSGGYDYIGSVRMNVLDSAQIGFSPMDIEVTMLTDKDSQHIPFETVNGGIQINCVHEWEEIENVASGCETEGYIIYQCSRCGDMRRESFDAIGHDWGEWEVTTPATCAEEGVETRVCARDASHVETRALAIDPEAHEWVETGRTQATCTSEGAIYYTCAHNPDHEKSEPIAIDPDAHAWGEWEVTTRATCAEEGVETRVCANDALHIETRAVAIDPDAHAWGEWKLTTPATCAAEGVETRVCANDETHVETRAVPIDPEAHVWTQVGMRDATCVSAGWIEYVCENDITHTKTVEIVINPNAHAWGEWEVTTPATCVSEGVETRVCAHDASHIETRAVAIDPDAHAWGEWEVTAPATCTEAAVETRVCANDPSHIETREGEAALGHEWGEWEVTRKSTFWQEGEKIRRCLRDDSHFETAAIDKLFKGDFDFDDKITVADALAALRIAAQLVEETEDLRAIGDIDRDGTITVADALQILRRSVKLISEDAWLA